MYPFLLLVLHGSNPTVDAPSRSEAAAAQDRDSEPAAKSPQKKPTKSPTNKTMEKPTTTTKPPATKPTTTKPPATKATTTKPPARPSAKPEPEPHRKGEAVRTKSENKLPPKVEPVPTKSEDKPPPKVEPVPKSENKPPPKVEPVPRKSENKPPPAKPPPSGGARGDDGPRAEDRDHGSRDDHDRDHDAHDGDRDHDPRDRDHGGSGGHDVHNGGADHDRPPAAHPHHSSDHRYARPTVHHLPRNPHAHAPPPAYTGYRGWYTHWWVHPYWRWQHATVLVVTFPYAVDPWADAWIPPARTGWVWVRGHFEHGFWVPGHWAPGGRAVAGYVYVPGWWFGNVYVSGYYRVATRDSWRWVDGRYAADDAYVPGHWQPTTAAPDGYTWEPGFFDGETWVEGYWRPLARSGYRWVPARTTNDGVRCSGYWQPTETRVDHVWVPGWFDGNQWVEGYWVTQREYDATDPAAWEPDPGWDADDEGSDHSGGEERPVAIAVPVVD